MSPRLFVLQFVAAFTPLFMVHGANGAPALGAHSLTNYNLGQNNRLSISTPPLNTQTTGSTILACIGRGAIAAFTQPPTDNKSNQYLQLGTTHAYDPLYPDSGTALYACATAAGGAGHIVSASTVAGDEVTLDVVEIRDAGVIQDFKWNEVLQGHPLTTLDVTTTGPATLVAFWWGDGNQYFAHTAVPDSGFTVIDSVLPVGSYVQSAVAIKNVTSAGSYHLTWNSGGNEGAQLWLVAIQSAPPPDLRVALAEDKVVVSWPTNAVGFALEKRDDLGIPNAWIPILTPPAVVNGRNVITNSASGPSSYYRLKR